MAFSRAKCTVTPQELATVLKGSMAGLDSSKYLKVDLDAVVEEFESLMLLVLKVTHRPTASILAKAASLAFEIEPQEAQAFGQRLGAAFGYCKQKGKSFSSGKKLTEPVRRVVNALAGTKVGGSEAKVPEGVGPSLPLARSSCSSSSSMPSIVVDDAAPGTSTTKWVTKASKEEILQLYGMQSRTMCKTYTSSSNAVLVDLLSSQETDVEKEALQKASAQEASTKVVAAVAPCKDFVQYLDTRARALVRVKGGEVVASAVMRPGPEGFAQGFFPGEHDGYNTELPNVLLQGPSANSKKRPAAAAALTRPASHKAKALLASCVEEAQEEEEEKGEAGPSAPLQVVKLQYSKLYYKATGAWAVRQKFMSKKQVFQIVSKHRSKAELESIVDEAINRLQAGAAEEVVKAWAKSKVKP